MDEQERRMAEIRSNFSRSSGEYDRWIRKVIPRYDEMLDVLVSCVQCPEGRRLRVIDIGCGTGTLSAKLLASHPAVELTCLDMTVDMLDMARERLKGHECVRYLVHNLYDFEYDGPYDLIISSLALHHMVTDEDKRDQYDRIFRALAPGGSFFNADVVLASDDSMQELYMEKWAEFMYNGLPREEVEGSVLPRYYKEDSPARLTDHLGWMRETGFIGVDVIWKYYNLTVYGGRKSLVD